MVRQLHKLFLSASLICIMQSAIRAQGIDVNAAGTYFKEMVSLSYQDGSRLWGVPLYGPMLFVDPGTREVVASQADPEGLLQRSRGVFVGKLPESVIIANTATTWAGTRWTMIRWPVPTEFVPRARLMAHECWHRIQDSLGLPAKSPACGHLDTLEGRYWLQLEWRALAKALASTGSARNEAIRDGCTFRAMRWKRCPGAGEVERALEMNEGLAEYTGFKIGSKSDHQAQSDLARRLPDAHYRATFVRSFAYETGPAYGLLLDAAGADWRKNLSPASDFAALLLQAIDQRLPEELEKESRYRATFYDGPALRTAEEKRAAEREILLTHYRQRFIDGPVLELPMADCRFSFDPDTLVPLEPLGTVYPTLTASADWGSVEAKKGAVITADSARLLLPSPNAPNSPNLSGDGWSLRLNAAWSVKRGRRAGNYIAMRQ